MMRCVYNARNARTRYLPNVGPSRRAIKPLLATRGGGSFSVFFGEAGL
jgi:hypothetical protein